MNWIDIVLSVTFISAALFFANLLAGLISARRDLEKKRKEKKNV